MKDLVIKEQTSSVEENSLPVQEILEAIQMSDIKKLVHMSDEQLYRVQQALQDDVLKQLLPKYTPAKITFGDRLVEIEGDFYMVRKMTTGDVGNITEAMPAIWSAFMGDVKPEDVLEKKSMQAIALELFSKATAQRIKGAMTALGESVLELFSELLVYIPDEAMFEKLKSKRVKVDEFCEKYLKEDKLRTCDPQDLKDGNPVETHQAVISVVAINAFFFAYVQQMLPDQAKSFLHTANTLLTETTGISLVKEFMKDQTQQQ